MRLIRRTPMTKRDDDRFDPDTLLHPANAFARPADVVNDPDLTLSEKRAILASWASDACAIEAFPALRHPPGKADEVIGTITSQLPVELVDVICFKPGTCPNCRSRGAVMADAITSGLAPG